MVPDSRDSLKSGTQPLPIPRDSFSCPVSTSEPRGLLFVYSHDSTVYEAHCELPATVRPIGLFLVGIPFPQIPEATRKAHRVEQARGSKGLTSLSDRDCWPFES